METAEGPTGYQLMILGALQRKQTYSGTVDPVTVAERRIRNRVARKTRRINRLRDS